MTEPSVLFVGAGLHAGVLAQRLLTLPKPPRITILEASDAPFGDHTWSFHRADVASDDMTWLDPMIRHRWDRQSVSFPAFDRELEAPYYSITSDSMRAALADREGLELRSGVTAAALSPTEVRLTDGERLTADCVIDARGFAPHPAIVLGHQVFLGLEVETDADHGVEAPMIMDATVDQLDGYRFIYLLPFAANRILIEDTRYADDPAFDEDAYADAIQRYAEARGWSIREVVRREKGVLPIALAFDANRYWQEPARSVPTIGMRAALFHPTTGYSLPEAVRVARLVADAWPIGGVALAAKLRTHALKRAREQVFYRFLNRMLFRAARPHQRVTVLQRFYRLGAPLIARFYAGRTTKRDALRLLTGRPPVNIWRAIKCLPERPLLPAKESR